MKNKKIIFYSLISVFLGACNAEKIEENFNESSIQNTILANTVNCDNGFPAAYSYNAFIQNNITIQNGDTEGPIAAGGDLTIDGLFTVATQSAGTYFHNNDDLASSFVIDGKVIYQSDRGIILNQGNLKIGDLTGSNIYDLDNNNAPTNTRITPGDYYETPRILLQKNQTLESIEAPNIIDFDTAFEELNLISASFSKLENTITIENGNKITLVNNALNVLNLTGEELNKLTNFTFIKQPTVNSPLIINIDTNGDFVWNVQNQAGIGDQHGRYILYNFYNSSQITIERGTSIMGSVLAPAAHLIKKSSDNINGQVIAKSYVHMGGELHHHPFAYCPDQEETECTLTVELKQDYDGEGYELYVDTSDETLSFEWSTGQTSPFIYVSPFETTTYTVTVTDLNGCSTTESITIGTDPNPVCALIIDLKAEFDGEGYEVYVDTNDEKLSFEWSTGQTSQFIFVFPFETTTYSVTVTDLNGCSATGSITIP